MNITHHVEGSKLSVYVEGDLDLHTAGRFRETVEQLLEHTRCSHLELHLAGVSFLDSSGLGVLLGRYKSMKERQGEMSIVAPVQAVYNILQLSGIMSIIPVYATAQQERTP